MLELRYPLPPHTRKAFGALQPGQQAQCLQELLKRIQQTVNRDGTLLEVCDELLPVCEQFAAFYGFVGDNTAHMIKDVQK